MDIFVISLNSSESLKLVKPVKSVNNIILYNYLTWTKSTPLRQFNPFTIFAHHYDLEMTLNQ